MQHHASSKRLLQLWHLEIAQVKSPWSSPFHRLQTKNAQPEISMLVKNVLPLRVGSV